MASPRFSIVIPTRERAETFRWTLRNCCEQDFDNYEVIVSDNHSTPATKQIVEELASPRVRYIRAPEPLAMSANWELGVSQARGEYVIVVGDDDALMPGALGLADRLLRESGLSVIRWDWVFYNWPDHLFSNQANRLEVPLGRKFSTAKGHDVAESVLNQGAWHPELPMLYNAVVHRSILETIKNATGRVFAALAPDIFSGMAVAAVAEEFGVLESPLSVCGSSGSSTGGNAMFKPDSPIAKEFWALNARVGIDWHPLVPRLSTMPSCYADTFLHVLDHGLLKGASIQLDRLKLSVNCLRDYRMRSEADRQFAVDAILASLNDIPDLKAEFLARVPETPCSEFRSPESYRGEKMWVGLRSEKWFCFNAADYGVSNVYEAAKLSGRILHSQKEPDALQSLQARIVGLESENAALRRAHADLEQTLSDQRQSSDEVKRTLEESLSCMPHRIVRNARRALKDF